MRRSACSSARMASSSAPGSSSPGIRPSGRRRSSRRRRTTPIPRCSRGSPPASARRWSESPPPVSSRRSCSRRAAGNRPALLLGSRPALVHAVEASAEEFVLAATERRRGRADALRAARPELGNDPWAALVLGRGWDGDPNAAGGPRDWPPLLYAAHSVYGAVDVARALLDRGAEPNRFAPNEHGHVSALFGAVAVARDPELTALLLERGADPNGEPTFGDALYHSVESPDPVFTRLLLDHGAEPKGTNALAHALDFDRLERVEMLLDAGASAAGGAPIVHAVQQGNLGVTEGPPLVGAARRGRGVAFLRLLVEHGAQVDAVGSEGWRRPAPTRLRTAYEHALLRGAVDSAAY